LISNKFILKKHHLGTINTACSKNYSICIYSIPLRCS